MGRIEAAKIAALRGIWTRLPPDEGVRILSIPCSEAFILAAGANVPSRASSRLLIAALLLMVLSSSRPARAEGGLGKQSGNTPSQIVIGFVGGFVHHDNRHQQPVRLAERIRESAPPNTYVQVFENRRRKEALKTILRLLDRDGDGTLSAAEKSRACIILFGHSWGASAAVMLARELDRAKIPVLLTVQVDSIAKLWQNDSQIPDNVTEAVNFYQPHGLVHGRQQIRAVDPSHTEILGNFLVDYNKAPVRCSELSWFDRFFTPSHAESQCDPHLWKQIEAMVRQRLSSQSAQTNPAPLMEAPHPELASQK